LGQSDRARPLLAPAARGVLPQAAAMASRVRRKTTGSVHEIDNCHFGGIFQSDDAVH
jgi:hypothetical protein